MGSLFEETQPAGPDEAAKVCAFCGSPELSAQAKIQACDPCRQKLIKRPFPWWVKVSAAAVLVMLIVALARVPKYWDRALQLTHAEEAYDEKNWEEAFQTYGKIELRYRNEVKERLWYAEAAVFSGHHQEAYEVLQWLQGRHVSEAEERTADRIFEELKRVARKLKPGPAPEAPVSSVLQATPVPLRPPEAAPVR